MSMSRSKMREHVVIMLFQSGFYKQDDMPEQMRLYLDDIDGMEPALSGLLSERAEAVIARIPQINEKIDQVSVGWTTARMGKVELAIMQMAVYEMLYDDQIPQGVAINEAVELAKKYCGEQASGFVNAILGKLAG